VRPDTRDHGDRIREAERRLFAIAIRDNESSSLARTRYPAFAMTPRLVYETVHGSRAYGLATAESDLDLKGVIVGPAAWYHGYQSAPEQLDLGRDRVHYEIRKLFRLASAANPTMLELLFTDPGDRRTVTPEGERLLAQRDAFLSRRVEQTFVGYALSQLKRIKGHRSWLLEPPQEMPTRKAFGLPETTIIPKDQLRAAEVMIERGRAADADLTPNFLELLQRERRYRQARRDWEHYQDWKKTRNAARAELEAQFGYDTKHAQHLVRLLRMGLEILRDGQVRVRRPDAEELAAIRAGVWSFDELIANAEALAASVGDAARTSALPEHPDEARLDALCAELVESALGSGSRARA
jgi:predicted nucleotidyltransferase